MNRTIDYGVDLGTTNSSIACCRGGEVRLFESNDGGAVTPSVVHLGAMGRLLVGKRAYDAWPGDPENTQAEFKRWMGFTDKLKFPQANREMSAEELSAEVLKSLRADAHRRTGESVTAAVITVPAAFGMLQCEATGRAAAMAGFEEAPLLQEPIAAAIAYGAAAQQGGQRWMVFDLGGGTLDIAIVSTRNGRLSVLEHQGNNRLGGKDIDRVIVERLLLPPLKERFKLPERQSQPAHYDRVYRKLVRVAEQAKIALTASPEVTADILELGDDLTGAPLEMSIVLSRAAVQREMEPLLEKCLGLAKRALEGSRLAAGDIDRVILVGGPTKMPVVQSALVSLFGEKLEHSIDPMTVVARGAALYASTVEMKAGAPAGVDAAPAREGAVEIQLRHERTSGTIKSPVAGTVPYGTALHEVKLDSDGGHWSSGWIPVVRERFVTEVLLAPGKPVTRYLVTGRAKNGDVVVVEPAEFSITYMLPMNSPPLPHAIALEVSSEAGRERYDVLFERHTPLPAEARRSYRADRTLRPSEVDGVLPMKFWETGVSEDKNERWWAGCIKIFGGKLKRPLMEGTEIELTVKIDKSRRIIVDAFIPALNQGFSEGVYVPDAPSTRDQLQEELSLCFERLARVREMVYAADREDIRARAEEVLGELEGVAERIKQEQLRGGDPDGAMGASESMKRLRVSITAMEEQLETERSQGPMVVRLRVDFRWTGVLVEQDGTSLDKDTFARLSGQFERYVHSMDHRGLAFLREELFQLRWSLVHNKPWYFEHQLAAMQRPGIRFINEEEAKRWKEKAEQSRVQGDLNGLRQAVLELWNLMPPEQVEVAKEQAMRSGLRE